MFANIRECFAALLFVICARTIVDLYDVKVDGCVFAIYNVGMMDHAVGVQQHRVSDGLYHTVRFTRVGPNSTLQVDDLPVQYKRPTGNITSPRHLYCY